MRCGPTIMGGLCLLFGLIPDWVSTNLIQPAVGAFFSGPAAVPLPLFHGVNMPLLLSVATLTLGGLIYFTRGVITAGLSAMSARFPLSAQGGYEVVLNLFLKSAHAITGVLQNGSLHRYLLITISVFTLTTAVFWLHNSTGIFASLRPPDLPLSQWLLVGIMSAAIVAVVVTRSRVLAVCALGIVGGGAALVFLVYGAPDLALTQLLVENLTLIIVSIVLLRLPPLDKTVRPVSGMRWVDGLAAVCAGILVAALSVATTGGDIDRQLTAFFEQNSVIAAHGRNIVNVILVDFRSLDTLGEITVMATAGLSGFALIHRRQK
jgi:multicomponent Na+:H+ antiporter subunit A